MAAWTSSRLNDDSTELLRVCLFSGVMATRTTYLRKYTWGVDSLRFKFETTNVELVLFQAVDMRAIFISKTLLLFPSM